MRFLSFTLLLSMLLWSGCAAPKEQGTPLGHHPQNKQQRDFDPSGINWEVDNGEGLRMHLEGGWLYLQFDYRKADLEKSRYIQFIIDSDANSSTGNAVENGADYIVENGYLYHAKQRDLWDWEEMGKVGAVVEEGIETVRIAVSAFGRLASRFRVNAEVLNAKFTPILYSPDAIDGEGNHLKTVYIPTE
jgi:hypothetical protein